MAFKIIHPLDDKPTTEEFVRTQNEVRNAFNDTEANLEDQNAELVVLRSENKDLVRRVRNLRNQNEDLARRITNIERGRTEGGLVVKEAVFQIPTLAETRLEATTSGVPDFHNVASFTGDGLSGLLENKSVAGVARVEVKKAGLVNVHFDDEIALKASNAGSTGALGEFVTVISHYDMNNKSLRSWLSEHEVSDPIISPGIKFPVDITTGLIPVKIGDYFTLNFAWMVLGGNAANKYIKFALPADNPGLDERFEFFFYE